MSSFAELYNQIGRLSLLKPKSRTARFVKIGEEIGELATALNHLEGLKSTDQTVDQITWNLLEEGVDSIQCILCLLYDCGIGAEQILETMRQKNEKWNRSPVGQVPAGGVPVIENTSRSRW